MVLQRKYEEKRKADLGRGKKLKKNVGQRPEL